MDQLAPHDALYYEKLKKEASSNVLGFRANARLSAKKYPRDDRHLLGRANTKDVPIYHLFGDWDALVASEVDALEPARKAVSLRNALGKQLRLSSPEATDLANHLVDQRISSLRETFLSYRYSHTDRARVVAEAILSLPADEIVDIRERFVSYKLHQLVAQEFKITFHDAGAPLLKRMYQKMAEGRQVRRYKRRQARRLKAILARQQELKSLNQAIISRILLLELDTVLVLDAHRQYKKQIDRLKPENRTPAKRLSLFATATNKIRDAHTAKQSKTDKLADLQSALKVVDDVLVELFDMNDSQRNNLMSKLKEYRGLEREASRITKEQAEYVS